MTTITKAPHTNPDLRHLALLAAGRTGADIERIVRELRANARRQKRPFDWSDLEAALRANGRRQLTPELARRIAIHEAGHALASIRPSSRRSASARREAERPWFGSTPPASKPKTTSFG